MEKILKMKNMAKGNFQFSNKSLLLKITHLPATLLMVSPLLPKRIFVEMLLDSFGLLPWFYLPYAPVENRKYRGSRRYVPRLVEEKITEFSSHFKYIFEDINNKTVKVNLINIWHNPFQMIHCNPVCNGQFQIGTILF